MNTGGANAPTTTAAGSASLGGSPAAAVSADPAPLEILFAGSRGGTLIVQGFDPSALTLLEEPAGVGCSKPAAPATRVVSLPFSPAAAPTWAAATVAASPGYSVAGSDSVAVFKAFADPSQGSAPAQSGP